MTSDRDCFVYIVLPEATEFVTAGRLQWTASEDGSVGRFVYRRTYREQDDAVELDPVELHLADRVFETSRLDGFFGAIRDSMPDFWGRQLIERSTGFAELAEFEYLLRGPDDRAGALGFGSSVEPPEPRRLFNSTLNLHDLQRGADAILEGDRKRAGPAANRIEELLLLGTSMGGARPKAVVEDERGLWIAKFAHGKDRWNHARVEHGMLALARECGLDIAESRIESVGGRDVLLVRRFDRDRSGAGYRRHRTASALTMLRASDGAGERGNWSYLLLADEVRRASERPKDDLRELFGRLCFNAAMSNLDDHPRNHAMLARGRRWRLSPAYDLMPSPVIARERRKLAMTCGRFGRHANRSNILSGHGRYLLALGEAEAVFDRIAGTVGDGWLAAMRRAGASEIDCQAIAPAILYDGLYCENASGA